MALLRVVGHRSVDSASQRRLSELLGVTPAALSKVVVAFGNSLGIRNPAQKSEAACAAYSRAQKSSGS